MSNFHVGGKKGDATQEGMIHSPPSPGRALQAVRWGEGGNALLAASPCSPRKALPCH